MHNEAHTDSKVILSGVSTMEYATALGLGVAVCLVGRHTI